MSTPVFIIEEEKLRNNLERLKVVKDQTGVSIIAALKAFSNFKLFPIIQEYLDGFTASSLHEAKLINEEAGILGHLCCPVYLEKELPEILSLGSHMTINSLSQLSRFSSDLKNSLNIGLRLNPLYSEVDTDMYDPCSVDSRLGVTKDELTNYGGLPDWVSGLHFHALCENDSYTFERVIKEIELQFSAELKQVTWVNFGGGHLITSKEYNADHLISILKKFKKSYPHIKIILEPGSAVVWQAGYLKSSIQDIIRKENYTYLMMDISVANHMPDCLEMPYTPDIRGAKLSKESDENKVRIGGMTCLAGDFIGDYSFKTMPQVGDELIIEDMIHYTTVKTTTFNGVGLPAIAVLKCNGELECIREFGYDDFKKRL